MTLTLTVERSGLRARGLPLGIVMGLVAVLVCAGGCTSRSDHIGSHAGAVRTPGSTSPRSSPSSSVGRTPTSVPPGSSVPTTSVPATAGTYTCHARGSGLDELPDPSCTPGVVNPAVTEAILDRTICSAGWTATVRPPESYTESLKYQQIAAYGDTGPVSGYEEDHLIPLELGGSPTDPRNLWPEPGASPNPKDRVESAANRAVCGGAMTLSDAQKEIAANWVAFGQQLGVLHPAPSAAPLPAAPLPASPVPPGQAPACTTTASYNGTYADWDVYVYSDQPDQTVTVTASDGVAASWHTDHNGNADVYLHLSQAAAGQSVTVVVGDASCSTTL